MISRREFFSGVAAAAGGAALIQAGRNTLSAAEPTSPPPESSYKPVVTPNGATVEWRMVDGVKVFHLTTSEFDHEFAPGLKAKCWGYNGRTPGPTIEAVEGDRLRIYVTNRLPEPTSVHWHGILLPNGMDGVSGLTQKEIEPGQTYKYEFTLRQAGTHMYHSHYDEMTQGALGMMGFFIIHPRQPVEPPVDRDFALMLSEWRIDPGASRPSPLEMTDFNVLTMNSKAFPGTAPLVVKRGERVRIRLGNLGAMEHHPIHLHGYEFQVTEIDGCAVPATARLPGNTVLVPVGATRALEFLADAPGDWSLHCHMSHHTMNQMGHNAANLLGVKTAGIDKKLAALVPGYMTMG
ncbi:MAG TPA: copper oxidase, partial [Chthoniobacteraceae bacterium]